MPPINTNKPPQGGLFPKPTTNQNNPFGNVTNQMPFQKTDYKQLKQGSLFLAKYLFWQHDPNPLVLVTDVEGDKIKGINLHYLTLNYVTNILKTQCGRPGFNYMMIRNDRYLVKAFRSYKRVGLRNIQMLDCSLLNLQFQGVRNNYKYDPQEIKALRDTIKQQIKPGVNPKAIELTKPTSLTDQNNQRAQLQYFQAAQPRNFIPPPTPI